jgi:hypothetical protein
MGKFFTNDGINFINPDHIIKFKAGLQKTGKWDEEKQESIMERVVTVWTIPHDGHTLITIKCYSDEEVQSIVAKLDIDTKDAFLMTMLDRLEAMIPKPPSMEEVTSMFFGTPDSSPESDEPIAPFVSEKEIDELINTMNDPGGNDPVKDKEDS